MLGALLIATVAGAAPANDNFSSAQLLSGWSGAVTGSNSGATLERKEPYDAFASRQTIWYRWTAPVGATAVLDTLGSNFDTVVSVYTGSRVDRLTLVARNDNSTWNAPLYGRTSRVEFQATASVTYQIQVDGMNGASGAVTLTWNRPPPANDSFAKPASLTGANGSVSGSNLMATSEPGEPKHAGTGHGHSVWYRWTAPSAGQFRFNLPSDSIGAVLGVYTGSAIGALTLVGSGGYCNSYAFPRCAIFQAVAATEYRIAVDGDGYASDQGPFQLSWEPVPSPPNDAFAAAVAISSLSGNVTGTTYGATREPGEPGTRTSIWYRFTPPFGGAYVFDTTGSRFTTDVAVWQGASVDSLAAAPDELREGIAYALQVTPDYAAGDIVLAWKKLPPENDDAEYPLSLTTSGTLSQNNAAATKEAGEASHAGNAGGASVWFQWWSPTPGTLTVDTAGSDFDTLLAVYRNSAVVASDDDSGGGGTSTLSFDSDGGGSYLIAVDGKNGAVGHIALTWTFRATPPANDDLANAQTIALEKSYVRGRTIGATKESGEPSHAGKPGGHSVWYRWVAPADGLAVFDTFDIEPCSYSCWFHDTTFDSIVAVYRGASVGALTPVAANDDHAGLGWSRVSFLVRAGEEYVVAVDGDDGATGSFALNWNVGPANDDFAYAQVLSGRDGTLTGSTFRSTWEGPDGGYVDERDDPANVWFAWRAPASGPVEFTVQASTPWEGIGVWTGPNYSTLRSVRRTVAEQGNSVTTAFEASAGTVYRLEVVGDAWGSFTLAWRPASLPPELVRPPNDDFASAQAIAGASGTVTGTTVGGTLEPGEPTHDEDEIGYQSVWYRWTAPADGAVTFDTAGSEFGTVVAVYGGSSLDRLREVAHAYNGLDPSATVVRFGAHAGETYSIAVARQLWYSPGKLALSWRPAAAPANDSLAAAQPLSGTSGSTTAANVEASRELGEPRHAGARGGASVWFAWTAPAAGPVAFQTQTSLDTVLAVYRADGGSLSLVAQNDDNWTGAGAYRNRVTWTAPAGITYYLAVDSKSAYLFHIASTTGSFTLSWRMPPSPANDSFAAATNLTPKGYAVYRLIVDQDDNFGATKEAGEPNHAGDAGGTSIWYRWDFDDWYWPTSFTVSTAGSGFNTLLAVYTGTSVSGLTQVAADDDSGGGGASRLTFQASAPSYGKTTYWIAVDGKGGASGKLLLTLNQDTAPPNDHFHAAAPIAGATGSISGTVYGASIQPGEPEPGGWSWGQSVWYRWTAPTTGTMRFDTRGTTELVEIGVYTGDSVAQLVEHASEHWNGYVHVPVVAGQTYFVLVNGAVTIGNDGKFTLNWRPSLAPAHDNLAAAQTLTSSSGSVRSTNAEASAEVGEPAHAGRAGGASLWYRWTAPFTGTAVLDTLGSSFDTVVAVYTGSSLTALEPFAANDDFAGDRGASVRFAATGGATYLIAIDGSTESREFVPTGDVTLSWQLAAPPANDRFADAEALAGDAGSVTGTTAGASAEPGEPAHGERAAGASVWYRWTAPTDAAYTFDTSASSFDALLGVYSGASVESLAVVRRGDDAGPRGGTVTVAAKAGETYRIAVDGLGRSTGRLVLAWSRGAPANDAFASAQPIAGRSGTAAGATAGATKEAAEPAHAGKPGGYSIWFRWQAPASEAITFDTFGSDFDTLLAVYTGSGLGALTEVGSSDDANGGRQSAVRFDAAEGTTYWIAVDGAETGNAVLGWSPTPKPPNDDFARAQAIGSREGQVVASTFASTREPGEPDHARAGGAHSAWYRYRAPAAGTVTFTTSYVEFDTVLAVYRGTSVSALTLVVEDNDSGGPSTGYGTSKVSFTVIAETDYYLAVDGVAGAQGLFALSWKLPPPNDDFANAQPLTGASGSAAGTTVGASPEPGSSASASSHEIWYRWVAPVTGTFVFDLAGSDPGHTLGVWGGSSFATLRSALYWQNGGRFGATAGVTYFISVDTALGEQPGDVVLNWRQATDAPGNDVFAAALEASGQSGTASVSCAGASLEAGEPYLVDGSRSVWFRWTAPASGRLWVDSRGTNADSAIGVYTGSVVDALTKVAEGWGTYYGGIFYGYANFDAVAGTTYRIAVRTYGSSCQLSWSLDTQSGPGAALANDNFANAFTITGSSGFHDSTTVGATKEPGEPNHAGNTGGHSVWYRWTAPASGLTKIDTYWSGFDTLLAVYTGSSVSALSPVAANDDDGSTGGLSSLTFNAVAGVTYRIAIDGKNGASGPYSVHWSGQAADTTAPDTTITAAPSATTSSTSATFGFTANEPGSRFECSLDGGAFAACSSPATYGGLAPGSHGFRVRAVDAAGNVEPLPAAWSWTIVAAPPNDDFAGATSIAGLTGSLFDTSFGATAEPGEPKHGYDARGYSVWYRWTAARDGRATIEVPASDFRYATVAVYTGASVGALTPVARAVSDSPSSRYAFAAAAGTTYQIAVDGAGTGNFRLDWRLAPPNDAIRDALQLAGASGAWRGDNVAATKEEYEPTHAGDPGGASIWFRWTAPGSGKATLETAGSDFDTLLAVYTASPFADWQTGGLIERAGDDNSAGMGASRVTLEVFQGTEYLIALDGAGGATGNVALSWSFVSEAQPVPPTVALTAPAAVVGGRVTLAATAADADCIDRVEFLVDGVVVGVDTTDPYSVEWDSANVADGATATISARALDRAGSWGTAAPRRVTVDHAPPETTIDAGPTGTTTSTSSSFSFSSSEAGASFECSLDGADFAACSSPKEYADLAVGTHTFRVRAKDPAGNVDAEPAERTWTIESVSPSSGDGS